MRKHGWFRPHVRGLTAISSTTLREGGGDIITSIFADGTDGFYFDFSKTDRLFQDQAFTPADDAGDNIRIALDAHSWAGKTAQQATDASPEQVGTNPDFTSDVTGWSARSGATLAWDNDGGAGAALVDITGIGGGITDNQVFALTVGKRYRVRWRIKTGTFAGALSFYADGASLATFSPTGSYANYDITFTAAAADEVIEFRRFTAATGTVYVDSISIKEIPGNHGLQATTSAQPKWQTGGLARFDGSDDNLLTTLVPGTATSLMFDVTVPATLAATQVICGGTVGTSRCVLAINTSGQLCAGLGTDATTVIVGSTDLRSTRAKVGLVFNGSLVKLYENAAEVYSAAQNGSAGSDALRLGASNNGGTAGSFWAGDTYKALAIKKALTAAQIAAITNKWGTS